MKRFFPLVALILAAGWVSVSWLPPKRRRVQHLAYHDLDVGWLGPYPLIGKKLNISKRPINESRVPRSEGWREVVC